MVSKNNIQVKDRYATKQVPHYGIRKLSVGVASVLLSTTLYMGVTAHADTIAEASSQPTVGQPASTTGDTSTGDATSDVQSKSTADASGSVTTSVATQAITADNQPSSDVDDSSTTQTQSLQVNQPSSDVDDSSTTQAMTADNQPNSDVDDSSTTQTQSLQVNQFNPVVSSVAAPQLFDDNKTQNQSSVNVHYVSSYDGHEVSHQTLTGQSYQDSGYQVSAPAGYQVSNVNQQQTDGDSYHADIPQRGFMNDFQGGFYRDGVWHWYYLFNGDARYNQSGDQVGGNGSEWYHITSPDLIHFQNHGVAIHKYQTEWGDVATGSTYVDHNNDFGKGKDTVIAFATGYGGNHGQNTMGYYSTDNGYSFKLLQNTPVMQHVGGPETNFRDPFLTKIGNKFVIYMAEGDKIGMYTSDHPLTGYQYVGGYYPPHPLLECPSLLQMNVAGQTKWVLFYGGNGGDQLSTGTYASVGHLDDKLCFVPEQEDIRVDNGPDFYGSRAMAEPDDSHDDVIINSWESNWGYATKVPNNGKIGNLAITRKLKLIKQDGKYRFVTDFVGIPNKTVTSSANNVPTGTILRDLGNGDAFQFKLHMNSMQGYHRNVTMFMYGNGYDIDLLIDYADNTVKVHRYNILFVGNNEFGKDRTFHVDLTGNLDRDFVFNVDRHSIEILMPDGQSYTMSKYPEGHSQEIIKILSDDPATYNYEYRQLDTPDSIKLGNGQDFKLPTGALLARTDSQIGYGNGQQVGNYYVMVDPQTVTVDSNTNDAFALDNKNGLHEHANVNDNGGYDKDYWGTLDVSKFTTVKNGDNLEITGYTGDASKVIIPNIADFEINGLDQGAKQVTISSGVMHKLAKNATRIGLSKTGNQKVVASDAIWQDAFGGMTNDPQTGDNGKGGMWVYNPNLTTMDLHNLDTTNITDMSAMFNGGHNLNVVGDLSQWNTANVASMRIMFQNASSLTNIGNLDNWDTSKVTDMASMFNQASKLTNIGDLSKWNTGNVTNMACMFTDATNLTNIGNLDNWNTGNVTNMSWMFTNATNLTNIGNLDNWNTGNVTNMAYMFTDATNLTNIGNLDNWNTGNVTNMAYMFTDATNLTNIGNLDNWNTGNVTNMAYMFTDATNLTNIGNLDNWNTRKVTDMHWMFANTTNLTNIGNLDNWNTSKVTDMAYMFVNAINLTNIGDLSKWDTGNVTDMRWMFHNATNLTNIGNLDNWNTSNVTDMNSMFTNATNLTNIGNLDNWNTSKVTDMDSMFNQASKLTNIGDLSNWDTSNVTNMAYMFTNAINLTNIGDLSKWNTSKVTNMRWMFSNATNLTNIGDLSKWQTGNVTDMNSMFISTNALRHLNISSWNLTKLANKDSMKYMFANDTDLTIIANDLALPAWYQTEINDADYFWNNHMAVITNVPELIKSTGDIDRLKIDDQNASRSIFYDSKGSSDALAVLKQANQDYIKQYQNEHPGYALNLAATLDQTNPIALANAEYDVAKPTRETVNSKWIIHYVKYGDHQQELKTPTVITMQYARTNVPQSDGKTQYGDWSYVPGSFKQTGTPITVKDSDNPVKQDNVDKDGKNFDVFIITAMYPAITGYGFYDNIKGARLHDELAVNGNIQADSMNKDFYAEYDVAKPTRETVNSKWIIHYVNQADHKQELKDPTVITMQYARTDTPRSDGTTQYGDWSYVPGSFKQTGTPITVKDSDNPVKQDNIDKDGENMDVFTITAMYPTISGYTMHDNINGTRLHDDLVNDNRQADTMSKDFYAEYDVAKERSVKVTYVDDDNSGQVVKSETFNGLVDQTVATNIFPPHNYYLTPNQNVPFTYLINANNPDIIIHLKHQIVGNDTQTDHISYATVKTSRKSLLTKLNQLYGPLVKINMVDPTTKVVNVDDVNNATKALSEARDFYNNQMDQIQQAFIDASHGKSVTLALRDLNLDFQVKREFKVTADIPMHDGTTQNQTLFDAHPTMHHELQMDAVTNHLGLGTWIVDQAYEKDGKKIPSYTLLEVHIDHSDYSIYNINIPKIDGHIDHSDYSIYNINIPKIDGYVNTLITNPKLNVSQSVHLDIIPDYTNVNRIRSLSPVRAIWWDSVPKWWDYDNRNDYSYYGNKAIMPSIYLNLKYIPLDQSNSIQYVDFDNNNVVAQTPITGKTDQTINLTYQLPEGYTYYDDPESFAKQYTFMAGENSPIQVYVVKNKNASIKNTSASQTNNINFLNTNHTNISQTVTGKIVSYNNFENESEDTWSVSNHTGFKDNLRPVNEFHTVTLGDIINTLNQDPNDFIKKYSIKVNGHDIGDLTNVNQVIIQATPVNQYTQNQTNTIDIVPKSITTPVYWQYDHDGTTDIFDATKISGSIGENVAVNLQVPENYDFDPDPKKSSFKVLPTQLAVRENPYYIPIKAKVVFIPSTDPKKSIDIVPDTDVNYPDTVAYNNLNKTTTRTINIYYSENNTMTVYQTVKMNRDAYFNLVTKKVTYTPWRFSNGHSWSSYKVPVNANQIADIPVVPEATVTPETNDTVVNVTVSDFNLYNSLIFDDVDNSNTELARYNVNKGLPIKWQDFLTNTLPNYEIVPGQTFNNQSLDSTPIISVDPNNTQNLVVYVKHKTRDVTSTDPNAHHTFTRDLIINSPNGLAHKSQTITFARSATLDLTTGEVIYGEWDKTNANLPEFTIPTYAGYTANGDTDKLDKLEDITPNTPDMHLSITYSPDSYIKRFCFVDSATGEVIDGYQSFANFANNSSSANLTPPPKYYFDSVQNITDPNAKLVLTNDTNATLYYTFAPDTDDTSIIQIRVKHDRSNINNKPDNTINYTRTIHITYPDGRRETMTQNAIKGDKWNAVNLAHFDNYQPDKTVNSEIATEDKTIEINYKPDSVTRTVTIRDADDNNKIIATKTITGLYDSSVSINNDIPQNYDLASDSSLIKLTNDTTIYVNHRKSYSTSSPRLVVRTINYIDKATGTKVRDSDVQTKYATFTTVTDLVTGKSTRTTDDYFDVLTVPTVKDFQQEGSLVPYQLADSNKTLTVYYDRTSGSSDWNNGTVTTSDIPIFIDPQVTTYLPDFSNLQLPSKADVGLA